MDPKASVLYPLHDSSPHYQVDGYRVDADESTGARCMLICVSFIPGKIAMKTVLDLCKLG